MKTEERLKILRYGSSAIATVYLAAFVLIRNSAIFQRYGYLEILFSSLFVLSFILMRNYIRYPRIFIVIIVLMSLGWELMTQLLWNYAPRTAPIVQIFGDMPLAVLFWWWSVYTLCIGVAEIIHKKYRQPYLFGNFIAVALIATPMEGIGFNIFKLWAYHPLVDGFTIPPYYLPWYITIGWFVTGPLLLAFIQQLLQDTGNCLKN